MEELQEADVLWPETLPPSPPRDQEHYYLPAPELYEVTTVSISYCESFGSEPAASSSSSTSTSSALLTGRRSSDGFLSDPSTAAGHDDDDAAAEEFQEADVLWPDDIDAAREREVVDGGELWWLCCGFRDATGRRAEPVAGRREAWRPLVSSPIDIPTGSAAGRHRRPTAVPVHRR